MHRHYLLLCLLALSALAACTDHDAQECVSDEECREGRVCMDGSCGDMPSVETPESLAAFVSDDESTYVAGYGAFPGQASDGFHIYLFAGEDGRASVFYEEGILGHGISPYQGAPKVRIDTSWRVDDDELVVGDVLRCGTEAEFERSYCTIERSVISDEAVGGRAAVDAYDIVRQLPSDATPEHEDLAAFQPE